MTNFLNAGCRQSAGRRASSLVASVLMASALSTAATAATSDETVNVPRATVVPVMITKEVRVGGIGASQEKKVAFEVAQDVIVDHRVIAKKGDLVEGHYTTRQNATVRVLSTNVSQEVALDIDDIVNFCGDTIHVQFERTLVGGARIGYMSFGAHSHDAVFPKGIVLKAKTDRLQKKVCSERTSASASAPPLDMMVSDEELPPKEETAK